MLEAATEAHVLPIDLPSVAPEAASEVRSASLIVEGSRHHAALGIIPGQRVQGPLRHAVHARVDVMDHDAPFGQPAIDIARPQDACGTALGVEEGAPCVQVPSKRSSRSRPHSSSLMLNKLSGLR